MTSPSPPNNKDFNKTNKKRSNRSGSRTFVCTGYPNCSMSFTRSEHLARHIRKHTGERPFKCEYCARKFSRMDNLRQHKQTVHAYENFVISYPGRLGDMQIQEESSAPLVNEVSGPSHRKAELPKAASEGLIPHSSMPRSPPMAASKSESYLSLPNSGPNRMLLSDHSQIPHGKQHENHALPSLNPQQPIQHRPANFYTTNHPQIQPSNQQQDVQNSTVHGFTNSSQPQGLPRFPNVSFLQGASNHQELPNPGPVPSPHPTNENKNKPQLQHNSTSSSSSMNFQPLQFRPMSYRPKPLSSPLPPNNNSKNTPGNLLGAPLSSLPLSQSQSQSQSPFYSSPQQHSTGFVPSSLRRPGTINENASPSSKGSPSQAISVPQTPISTTSSSTASSVGSTHTRFWLNSVLNNNDPVAEPDYGNQNGSPSPTSTSSSTSTLESTKCNIDSLLNE
ncbi:Putative transcription factor [Komagataella phaffii CBS 7435]|uniref:Transcription factor containing a C2H2 zinc finger n=2 Tax=Komagataella phaffii TaxID=460519 RepID=C4R717_KOMPG|nr:Putative transcription factor containing a C2H2 zinc finger [Komagataella phaffii GS115]AOA65016.1 GQ67_04477T0 [Komagataella phaffii]CAH2451252.1 Putative transcription factor [Komagataella phaffii CBS 7435]AOA69659.1 GQ68_04449T0 [Komagataella phaffii GS115]CAY71392.1 Putative transcription factor containing a C2H2 zinc finger [Komagataella phaffii GS115]CCA41003.1 Putative transcription factor [Komagataella phaffii CBS 7435]